MITQNDVMDFSTWLLNYEYSGVFAEDCLREIKNRFDSLPKNMRPFEKDNFDILCTALKAYKGELKEK